MTKQTNSQDKLYKAGAFQSDPWKRLADGDNDNGVPEGGAYFASFAKAKELLSSGPVSFDLGVIVEAGDDVEELAEHYDAILAFAVDFPAFADGRGFSTARLLRERHGYKGEIRAIGAYILDQMPMLMRCGVDAFWVEDDAVRAGLERGEWPEIANYYQPTGREDAKVNDPRPWLRRRLG
ncbi:MAG: DUF934 domain-containing protein [Cohaesibacter sp.]|nr:DUF934 domain-containing protein [Cohaesibacter sp.]